LLLNIEYSGATTDLALLPTIGAANVRNLVDDYDYPFWRMVGNAGLVWRDNDAGKG
jgi:hypothetical protein